MMLLLFLGLYIVLAVLVYMMFKILINSINKKSDESIIDKLQKKSDVEDNLDVSEKKVKYKKFEAQGIKNDLLKSFGDFHINIFDVLNEAKNKGKTFVEIERLINDEFDYDKEKIIKEFINKADDNKNFDFCKKLESKFTPKRIYELKTSSVNDVDKYLKKILNDDEYSVLELYRTTHEEFNLDGFVNYLNELVRLNNPVITIYVGNKDEKYDYLDKNIRTVVDENIYCGIKIGYRGKIYDFSLNGRNL